MPCFSISACTALMANDTTSSQSSQKDSASCASGDPLTAQKAAAIDTQALISEQVGVLLVTRPGFRSMQSQQPVCGCHRLYGASAPIPCRAVDDHT